MARSLNVYTTKRLAYAAGYNYLWAPQFYEASRGSRSEQVHTIGHSDTWGLHGNAILSRWSLERPSVIKFPNGHELFRQPEVDDGEHRIGARHALFAEAAVELSAPGRRKRVTVAVLETMPRHGLDSEHGQAVVRLLKERIDYYDNEVVVLGGKSSAACHGFPDLFGSSLPSRGLLAWFVRATWTAVVPQRAYWDQPSG
jgi:hypothetical protein